MKLADSINVFTGSFIPVGLGGWYMSLLALKCWEGLRGQTWRRSFRILWFCSVMLHPWTVFAAQLTLTWDDNANDETGFRIERRVDGAQDYVWVAAVATNAVSYADNSVERGKSYCYRVQAYNPGGLSDYSNEACALVANLLSGFESPENAQAVSGIGTIRGWAFDAIAGRSIDKVELFVNGSLIGELPCCSPRGDVQAAFPQFPADNTANSGWGTGVNWGELTPGSHLVQVKVTSTSGEVLSSDVRTVTVVRPGTSRFVDVFSLARASTQIDGPNLILRNVVIRDKATQQQSEITATFRWFTNAQGFILTQAVVTNDRVASLHSLLLARTVSAVREWWQNDSFGPQSAHAASNIITLLESPDSEQSVFGINVLRGWAFDNDPNFTVRTIRLTVDDAPIAIVPCCSGRQDVAAAFLSHPNALNSGWGITANYANLPAGVHTIGVQIESSAGVVFSTSRPVTVVKVEGVQYIDLVDFTNATARIEGEDVVISKVRIRDAATQQVVTVQFRLRWSVNSQSLGIVAVN